jgi:hypothetical protein
LSPLELGVKQGQVYRFELSSEVAPLCVFSDAAIGSCARASEQCRADSDCDPAGFAIGVSVGGSHYQRGKMFINGEVWPSNSEALKFITYVAEDQGEGGAAPDVVCPGDGSRVLEPKVVADQVNEHNQGDDLTLGIGSYRAVGQTFTVGQSGKLVAIQIAPALSYGAQTADTLTLTLSRCTDIETCSARPIASTTVCAAYFTQELPELAPGKPSQGLFDLAELELEVREGEVYLFQLREEVAPNCLEERHECANFGHSSCNHDSECHPGAFAIAAQLSESEPHYTRGRLFTDGNVAVASLPDLNFITYVEPLQ